MKKQSANPIYKIGSPYKIKGKWYHPKEDKSYDKVGIASWYGRKFHKRLTANGEIFNMYRVSAAHPTLPMPIMVKVTNLENGRALKVRVNDRGPFVANREIDLSRRAAKILGFYKKGTARVRVEYLYDAPLNKKAPFGVPLIAGKKIFVSKKSGKRSVEKARHKTDNVRQNARQNISQNNSQNNSLTRKKLSKPRAQNHLASKGAFFVQLGLFEKKQNAMKLREHLNHIKNIVIDVVDVSYGKLFRVRIGPISTREQANAMAQAALYHGAKEAVIMLEK